ncbi:recombinase family protein [uncultured Enterovirga sp.]|uniref:recombinase family protein n=1 Tax=uncultured Enterovirga sp. TaxID=2026352 RepID=UPI0035CC79E2
MKPSLRCAVYTRVSTEHGLDQEFNSLDNQREAAEAYVKSQAHEGWRLLPGRYDDGGFSGGSTERPALQRLLEQVRLGRVDVIVVYKVDRLTRSLADFAKLVELFDQHGVSFVSVTQSFNTTTSMGRLTLNVLLSFAQFEREVTSERIRDKIAASKRRGLWVGGMVPLGYRVESKKLVIEEEEAERVRLIFRRYLETGSLGLLLVDLREQGVVTKLRQLSNGRTIGGIPFTRGPLAYLLRNRFYVGEISFKGTTHKAEHAPILGRNLFEAVQVKLAGQRVSQTKRGQSGALLVGRIYDSMGQRFTPTHAKKNGIRYRYYISASLVQGRTGLGGTRIPAPEIERTVIEAIRTAAGSQEPDHRALIETHLDRLEIGSDEILVRLRTDRDDAQPTITIPWRAPSQSRHREIIVPPDRSSPTRPMRVETRATLLAAIAKGRRWLDEIIDCRVAGPDAIAAREGCTVRQVNATISLAHLAPDIVEAAIAGRLPHGVGVRELTDAPLAWSRQRDALGLAI